MINVLDGRTSIYMRILVPGLNHLFEAKKAFLHHLKWEFWVEKCQSWRRNLYRNSWQQWLKVRYFISVLVLLCFYYNDLETQVGFNSFLTFGIRAFWPLSWYEIVFIFMPWKWFDFGFFLESSWCILLKIMRKYHFQYF